MHQIIQTPNLWNLYLDSDSLQNAVDCWPKEQRAERFLALLFSESTEEVTISEVYTAGANKSMRFTVKGRCYDDEPCVFDFVLYGSELTQAQKEGVREFVKVLYARERPLYSTPKRICKALGVMFK